MVRPLSDTAIEYRVRVAYLRTQALARNEIYSEAMLRLQNGWDQDGVHVASLAFDEDGQLASPPCGLSGTLVDEICNRSGLILPCLPEHLKQMSPEDLRAWHNPLFEDVPGWKPEPKARRRRTRPNGASITGPKHEVMRPISLEDFVPIDEEAIRDGLEKVEAEFGSSSPSSSPDSLSETIDRQDFKAVAVPLRQLGQRHHGLDDGYSECWKAFDWHQDGVPDTEIAKRLWPEFSDDASVIRHRVHQRLKTARGLIGMVYRAEPLQREKRRKRGARAAS